MAEDKKCLETMKRADKKEGKDNIKKQKQKTG